MSLIVVGVSHKTAPVELRERLSIPKAGLGAALDEIRSSGAVEEAVVLSTCNRLEIYGRSSTPVSDSHRALSDYFNKTVGNPSVSKALYRHDSRMAVSHLFKVAAGLDSMVVGETDVLGQVKAAYLFAHNHGATGKIANVLFQRALFVGKAVRNKTPISEGASSVGAVAVQMAERIFGKLNRHRVLLLGAGKIAEVTSRHMLCRKAGQMVILNRTRSKAEALARQLNGTAGTLDQLEQELSLADIVICSTGADRPIVTRCLVQGLMKARGGRTLYFIDIAVPRNVDPGVHDLENVYVYNIDDLKGLVEENMGHRRAHVTAATTLVENMADEFYEWAQAALEGRERPLRHSLVHDN